MKQHFMKQHFMKQHFQRGQASTELEIYKVERLALNNA